MLNTSLPGDKSARKNAMIYAGAGQRVSWWPLTDNLLAGAKISFLDQNIALEAISHLFFDGDGLFGGFAWLLLALRAHLVGSLAGGIVLSGIGVRPN